MWAFSYNRVTQDLTHILAYQLQACAEGNALLIFAHPILVKIFSRFCRRFIMGLKRSASETRLVSRPSPFNASVVLFEASELSTAAGAYGSDSPRRSKRVKRVVDKVGKVEEAEGTLPSSVTSVSSSAENECSESPKKQKSRKAMAERSSSPKKNKPLRMELDEPHPAPAKWSETYEAINEMRKKYVAPVDTMGCDKAKLNELDPRVRCPL